MILPRMTMGNWLFWSVLVLLFILSIKLHYLYSAKDTDMSNTEKSVSGGVSMFPKAKEHNRKDGWEIDLHFLAVLQTKMLDDGLEFLTCEQIEQVLITGERLANDNYKQKVRDQKK